MTIEEKNVVDFIGTDKTNGAIGLLISDHLEWTQEKYTLLKDKVNAYLDFIESGELEKTYPESQGKPVYIELVHQVPPDEPAKKVLEKIKKIVAEGKVEFTWSQFVDD